MRPPFWRRLLLHTLVTVLVVTFVTLGFWQLRRLEERRLENAVASTRVAADPQDLETLLTAVGTDVESLRYRRARVTGVYHPEAEVLVRSQVHQGVAGYHVLTPLLYAPEKAVLINRGWVPLTMDQVPVEGARVPEGEVTVTGVAFPTQVRRSIGPVDPATGVLNQLARVDIPRLDQQMPWDLAPVYLIAGEAEGPLPVPPPPPDFTDEGPHLLYAVQWFAFAIIGLVGYFFLLSRSARLRR